MTLTDPVSVGANALDPGPGRSETPPSQGDGFTELFAFADFGFTNDTPNYDGRPKALNTATLIATGLGVVSFAWTDSLSFYDIQGAQAAVASSFTMLPEPTTAALMSLRLVGLAVRRRRRRP